MRLTHRQWDRTAAEVLSLPGTTGLAEGFVPDVGLSRFDTDREAAWIDPVLWSQYQAAAEALALRVVEDDAIYRAVVPVEDRDPWLSRFLPRAFRRPVTPGEHEDYAAVFDAAPVGEGVEGFRAGVRATIAAALQSPAFLYRTEGVGLPGPELAARLSYAAWDSPPDPELTALAADGLDADEQAAQAARLAADPRAHDTLRQLHQQWLHLDAYGTIPRPTDDVKDFEGSLAGSMLREVNAYVDDVVLDGGTLAELLTSRQTRADEKLAVVYDLEGITGEELVPVSLPPEQRAGVLTLSGFLALHADAHEPSLIRRGGFVADAMLCATVPPPPANVPPLPPPRTGTQRARIEAATSECGGACHAELLNPLGFAFNHYDQEGGWRDDDHGDPIDATGTVQLESGRRSFDGAVELAAILAEEPEAHRCFARHLVAFYEGRVPDSEDDERIEALAEASRAGRSVLGLLEDVLAGEAMRTDAPAE